MLKTTSLTLLLLLVLATPAHAGWSLTGSLREPRSQHGAVLLKDGRVLVAGGYGYEGTTRSAELYDPATGAWTPAAPMSQARVNFAMVTLGNGLVLAAGGQDDDYLNSAELYDPATNTWVGVPSMAASLREPSYAALANGRALVSGAYSGPNGWLSSAQTFDPATRQWSPASAFNGARWDGPAVTLQDGRVLFAPSGRVTRYVADLFDPVSGWNTTAPMRVERFGPGVSLLANGSVLVTGAALSSREAELYNPVSNLWSPAGTMLSMHWRHSQTTLTNGQVLVAGGADGAHTDVTELFDPVTASWSSAGLLSTPRSQHTGTRLADGRVLVAGGGASGSVVLDTAELYTPSTSLALGGAPAFGAQTLGAPATAAVQVTNTGDSSLFLQNPVVSGAQAGDFVVSTDRCRGAIAPGATCALDVRFTPSATGVRDAVLTLRANTSAGTHSVALTGSGVVPAAAAPTGDTADADGDGVLDGVDRCVALPGPATRTGCPTGLLADPSIRYVRSGKGIRVVAYYVKATTGATVLVQCSKGCRPTTTKGRGSRRVRITRLNGKRLAHNAKITITVSMPGRLTTTVNDRITRGRRIEGRPRCSPVGC